MARCVRAPIPPHRSQTPNPYRGAKINPIPPPPPSRKPRRRHPTPSHATHNSPTKLVAGSRRAATTTASALPLAELAAVGPEIAEVAITCFSITLVGLAVGFVLLRVEAAVEGEE